MPRKLSKLISSTKQKIGLGSGSGSGAGGATKKSTSHQRRHQSGGIGGGAESSSQRQQLLDSGDDYDSVSELQLDLDSQHQGYHSGGGAGGAGNENSQSLETTSARSSSHQLSKSPSDQSKLTKSSKVTSEHELSNTQISQAPSTSNVYGSTGDGGTGNNTNNNNSAETSGFRRFFKFASTPLTSGTGYNELYTEQKNQNSSDGTQGSSWWQSNFQLLNSRKPVLFGTWDGVFITCLIHLFGVISFLRTGWLVGNDGILISCAVVFGCLLFTTVSLLAAIGIMERCAAATSDTAAGFNGGCGAGQHQHINPEYPTTVASARANVHLLISTVLGSRIGGAISLIYCFGQAVSCALHVTGFTETFVQFCALFIERHLSAESVAISKRSGNLQHINQTTTTTTTTLARTMARFLMIDIQMVENGGTVGPSSQLGPDNDQASVVNHNQEAAPAPMMYQLILTNYTYQLVSGFIILVLFLFSILGVRCLFRLQTVLFMMLMMAIVDFSVGLFETHPDYGYGTIVASKSHLMENLYPNHEPNQSSYQFWMRMFATVGVYFPSAIGVMAGVNMGSDLKTPVQSIPTGSLGAVGSSLALHLLFIVGLGLTCTRTALLNDYSIQHHVSAFGLFFLLGLYMSAISSSLGSMYTAPRIMQNLAQELHSFPLVRCFGTGRGPNKIPVNALILFTLFTLAFVMLGGINVLAPIVTIPYLLTYATIEYAYFSMAMTFDIQISREKRFMAIANQLRTDSPDGCSSGGISRSTTAVINGGGGDTTSITLVKIDDLTSGGGTEDQGPGIAVPPSPTPSVQQHLAGYGSVQSITQHIKIKRRQSTQSSSSSGGSDDELGSFRAMRALSSVNKRAKPGTTITGSTSSLAPSTASTASTQQKQKVLKPKTIRQLMAAVSDDDDDDDEDELDKNAQENEQSKNQVTSKNFDQDSGIFRFDTATRFANNAGESSLVAPSDDQKQNYYDNNDNENQVNERLLNPDPELAEIACKQETWYLRLMNRWIVLAAAILKLVLMFFVAWHYAAITVAMFMALYVVIGRTNPGYYPGVSEFVLLHWIRNLWNQLIGRSGSNGCPNGGGGGGATSNLVASFSYDRIVLPPSSLPNLNYQADQLTSTNSDYSGRQPFHHSTTINPQFAN